MDERTDRLRRRFESMLSDARAAIADAAPDPLRPRWRATSLLATAKALNRAGGFLEAVAIVFPELGLELIDRFEEVARDVERIHDVPAGQWVTRAASDRRSEDDRRRPGYPGDGDRWGKGERRTAQRRALSDRRFGARTGG